MEVTATEFKTNLGKYIDYIATAKDGIIVTKNGKKVLQISKPVLCGTERLASLIKSSGRKWDYDELKKGAMETKYDITL